MLKVQATNRCRLRPRSCSEKAENLKKTKNPTEQTQCFREADTECTKTEAYGDKSLWRVLSAEPEKLESIVVEYLYWV